MPRTPTSQFYQLYFQTPGAAEAEFERDPRRTVRNVLYWAPGEGVGMPKSAAGERSVPLTPIVVNTLREWKLACPKGGQGLVFPTGSGNVESHSNIVKRGLWPTLAAAGVRGKYAGLHAFRHFYASWCINRRVDGGLELPAKVVQERLGHSSITMTMDTYGHLFPRGDDASELAAAERSLLG